MTPCTLVTAHCGSSSTSEMEVFARLLTDAGSKGGTAILVVATVNDAFAKEEGRQL